MDIISMLNLILIVLVVLILVLGGLALFFIFRAKNKANKVEEESKVNETRSQDIKTTKDGKIVDSIYKFMEFDDVVDNMIVRKNRKQYVMVIQCQGINYDLLSEDEKIAVEEGFVQFLNTLRFPIQLYLQTRSLNLRELIEQYDERIELVRSDVAKLESQISTAKSRGNQELVERLEFELRKKNNILEYGEDIAAYTERISQNKNVLQQKTYIIVSYFTSEFGDTSTYSKEEIDDIAFSELYTRCQTLIRTLASAEVFGKVLNSEELVELLYVAYNRDESEVMQLNKALDSQYDRLYSTGRDVLEKKQEKIEKEIMDSATIVASQSIMNADKANMEKRKKNQKIKDRAMELVEDYKGEMSRPLYEETKKQIEQADVDQMVEEANKPKRKRQISRKSKVTKE